MLNKNSKVCRRILRGLIRVAPYTIDTHLITSHRTLQQISIIPHSLPYFTKPLGWLWSTGQSRSQTTTLTCIDNLCTVEYHVYWQIPKIVSSGQSTCWKMWEDDLPIMYQANYNAKAGQDKIQLVQKWQEVKQPDIQISYHHHHHIISYIQNLCTVEQTMFIGKSQDLPTPDVAIE